MSVLTCIKETTTKLFNSSEHCKHFLRILSLLHFVCSLSLDSHDRMSLSLSLLSPAVLEWSDRQLFVLNGVPELLSDSWNVFSALIMISRNCPLVHIVRFPCRLARLKNQNFYSFPMYQHFVRSGNRMCGAR